MQLFSVIIGVIFGSVVGLMLFCYLVPGGSRAIGMYRSSNARKLAMYNRQEMEVIKKNHPVNPRNYPMMVGSENPYMIDTITSEQQFLSDMIEHHEAALVMAQQAVALPSISKETKDLATTILTTQENEIALMKSLLTAVK